MLVGSAIFNRMSGKFNGAVAVDGRAGPALRSHVVPANPKTAAQQQVRNALRQVSAQFFGAGLTAAQRAAWVQYAAGASIPGRLGGTYRPTASQAFVAVNALRVQMGLATVVTPPPAGRVAAAVTLAWEDETLTVEYPAPAAGTPDALALGGGLRVSVARRPVYHARRYGSWDAVRVLLGQNPRPGDGGFTVDAGANAAGFKLFYRVTGSTPSGQPVSVMEGVIVGA